MKKAVSQHGNSIVHQLFLHIFREQGPCLCNHQVGIYLKYSLDIRIAAGFPHVLFFQQSSRHVTVFRYGNYSVRLAQCVYYL
ncbi:MAG: hypothetical protein A4E49_02842 [Methanosaeta sp. PtaU1.Bin112]|nr:MAG: hypothetical protein A4E49_02842 [Methanosaeta sp. PtaU1.Bin112]